MGPIQTAQDALSFLRRRAALIALVFLAGAAISVVYALRQAHVYEATAVLQIEAPKIADTLAASTVGESAARRLQTIEQRMMARDNIAAIIEEFGLFTDLPALTPTEKVVRLRKLTTIRGIDAVSETREPDGAISGVRITVRLGTAELAQIVANELAARLIALSKAARIERTQTTLDFFAERETKLADAIEEVESRIAEVRNAHELTVSGGVQFRRVQINSLQEALIDIERDLLSRRSEIKRLGSGQTTAVDRRRIGALEDEIEALETQKTSLSARRDTLAATIEGLPEVEHQLNVLESRLEQLQAQYGEATRNRADAETGHVMELTGQAETLRVIEPAALPDYPVAPGRKKIAAKGLAISLAVALILALGLDLRRPVIRSAAQMERELGLRPVVEIGHFASPYEMGRSRWVLRGISLVILTLALLIASGWWVPI